MIFVLCDKDTKHGGYTLIELAIVLVIIGLIVGGILTGRELIHAAEIRATIGQYEKFNTATNTFRSKYGGLPGDLLYSNASAFGFFAFSGAIAGRDGGGDQNSIIRGVTGFGPNEKTLASGENIVFWRHLSEAQLVEGNYGVIGDAVINPLTGEIANPLIGDIVANLLPRAKVGFSDYFTVYSIESLNYFELHTLANISQPGGFSTRTELLLRPLDAYRVDNKLDDGLPNTGSVIARGSASSTPPFGEINQPPNNAAGILCVQGAVATDLAAQYLYTNELGACALRLQFN